MTCIQFQTWLRNCRRFSLDCSGDIHSITTGTQTLNAIFKEQEALIKSIANDYRRVNGTFHEGSKENASEI